ncbi:MAG TPA: pyridoxamine 5'-phosphate oxidase family protein [Candidatus Limnocylindrales bacterium]|nr:pyridoxamine 5'-phosphate oxidase family protein [Candidatus Limnocylindrales bacterium]
MDPRVAVDRTFARIDRMLRHEQTVWLSTVSPDGSPHLVPIWFSWNGDTILIASKPNAKKVANLRHNPSVMLALGAPEDDFDVGMVHGVAELPTAPAADMLPAAHLAKYRDQMTAIGLTPGEFLATYRQVVRIRPTRFLPWHGRTAPASADPGRTSGDRRLAAAIRRVAASLETRPLHVAASPAG